ncbi:hypothetical protein IWW36_000835 [Coemansia brasiliensis]|uniref:P-loop containing nucleoside triphosphate hydrolase protein n=1 Tax=Coemansia brasiliensis TaxID=2650707 RepID=A0A9W8M0V9_9FUNG|nr:hypothetical protein IWW36_000835 [Coemansia brasiliensis]
MLGLVTRLRQASDLSLIATAGMPRVSHKPFSTSPQPQKSGTKSKLTRQEQVARMKKGRHMKRLDAFQSKGRSGGGQSQLLEARMRRASEQKKKFHQAREFVHRLPNTQQDQQMAEARILRQRSRQLKQRGTPGLGFTPARFRLLPIENESGTDLTAISTGSGANRKVVSVKELKEKVAAATFDNIGLHPTVADTIKAVLAKQTQTRYPHQKDIDIRPTEIQALGIPEILGYTQLSKKKHQSPNVFLAAETGSGKTFAYALPLITMLKREEETHNKSTVRRDRRPRALVLVPSRELAVQVTCAFKSLAHQIKFRALCVHLGLLRRDLRVKAQQGPIDVMVATPAAALRFMLKDPIFTPGEIRHIVVDEADSMMDEHSFGDQIKQVLNLVSKANETQGRKEQAIFVSATLPKLIREQIIRRYPDVVHVTTPSLHRAPQKLTQTFIDVAKEYQGHRLNALWYVLRTAASDKHLIIFCNNKAHANLVYRQLYKRGIPSLLLAGASPAKKPKPRRAAKQSEAASSEARPDLDDPWERETWFAGQEDTYAAIDDAIVAEDSRENQSRDNEASSDSASAEDIGSADVSDLEAPIPEFNREDVLASFLDSDPIPKHLLPPIALPLGSTDASMQAAGSKRKILVCTDLGSRGLDTTCVTHVVLFDFPTTAIDYLHRAGRTARAGGRGKVTALVGKKDRRLAEQIRLAVRQGGIIN